MLFSMTKDGVNFEDALEMLHSARGVRKFSQALVFGAKTSLLNKAAAVQKMNDLAARIEKASGAKAKDDFTESQRYKDTLEAAYTAAERLRSIELIMASDDRTKDIIIEVEAKEAALPNMTQLSEVAMAAGLTVQDVAAARIKQANAQTALQKSGELLANTLFFGAIGQTDIYLKPEMIQKALESETAYIAGWSKPDLAELVILKKDKELVNDWCDEFDRYTENAGESSREIDDLGRDVA